MAITYDTEELRGLREVLAARTNTCADDWFCVFKARYGMQVVLRCARELHGDGEVITQLFTCCTTVDAICASGLTPRYEDISRATFALDPARVATDAQTRAVVAQHTFGIINERADAALRDAAHAAGALLMEDNAHCVGRLSRDAQGEPLADVSVHSFGVEKVVPDTYFGGAIWVNPHMPDAELRARIVAALESLPPVGEKLARAAHDYRNQVRILTRLPGKASARMRERLTASGAFEPAVSEAELNAHLPLEPMLPSDWVAERATDGVRRLDSIEERRRACVDAYVEAFAAVPDTADLLLPANLASLKGQPLLRFPVSLGTAALSDRARNKVASLGFYAVPWYRPLLFPGVNDLAAYGWDGTTQAWPEADAWWRGSLGLPTDIEPNQAREVARAVLELAAGAPADAPHAEAQTSGPRNLSLVKTGDDVRRRLVPVCVGGDLLAYTYAREFHRAYGIRTVVLSGINVRMTSSSALCDYRIVPNFHDEDALVDYLDAYGHELAAQGKLGLLVGLADWHMRVLASHKERLSRWFVVPYNDLALIDEVTNKRRFYEICEELGIAYPKTWYVDCAAPDPSFDARSYPYPLIAKPASSPAWDAVDFEGKKKIYEIQAPEELERAYADILASDYAGQLVIQDFIPGGDEAIRSLTTFSDASGDLRVVSGGRVALQDHSPMALGNPVCILSEKVDQVIADARKFLAHTGYRGYANFDVKYDSRDGSYRFFEVNARPGRNTFYVSLGGVNYVQPIVSEWVLGHEVERREAYDPFLYTIVPAQVVKTSVTDEALRAEVLACYRDGRAHNPLFYEKDSAQHRLWSSLYTQNRIRKFKRYPA